ncbi:MAG: DNA recombinase [Phycisphaerae bacterium SM23_30]|nr:MAG: DNA recombinase [Phycisphaerae bacterium SM23_30]
MKTGKNDDFRVAIYARVSSDQQSQAGTIASQIEALQERLAKENLKLETEFSYIDDGYTGATFIRPALERLRDAAAAGAIDRVYVHSPDRLARKYAYQVLLVDELERCGVEVVFLNRQLGQSPEDDLLLQVQGMIAEYERAKILERSRRGKLHAARQGSVNVLSGAPYGYRYISCQEGAGQASYEIVLEQARVVRQIFEWIGQDRLSLGEVTRRLIQQAVATRTGKDFWDRTTVWGILKNPAYKGLAAYGKTRTGPMLPRLRMQRGDPEQPRRAYSTYHVPTDQWHYIPVPALVSEELFEVVQEQLIENKKRNRQTACGARYLLQGLLVCKKCGYAYYGKPVSLSAGKGKRRSYAYYRCIGTDAYRFGGQRLCYNKQVRTDLLEESVWQDVCSLLKDPQRVAQEYQRRLTTRKKGVAWSSIEQLRALIQKVKRGIARLVDAYQDGLIDKPEFEPRLRKAKERLAKLQVEVKTQEKEESRQRELKLVISCMKEFAGKVNNNLEVADWMTKREIIRSLVKQIEVEEESVRVVYRVPPPPFVQAPEKGFLQDCLRRKYSPLWRALLGRKFLAFRYTSCLKETSN